MFGLPKIFACPEDDPVVSSPELAMELDRDTAGANDEKEFTATTSSGDDESTYELDGVKNIEAVNAVWSRNQLILAYILIWLVLVMSSLFTGVEYSLSPFVTSAFDRHTLTATTIVFAQLIGGLFHLPLAKILDIWGRPQGLALSAFFLVIGWVMMAACNNVETYAAAQVFYWIGTDGIIYSLTVFVSDTSSMRNRAFAIALIQAPSLITVWVAGPVAAKFLDGPGWRWAFGAFAIVVPIVIGPLLMFFAWNYHKAKTVGTLPAKEPSGRTICHSLKHYFIQFDIVGLLLVTGGLALILLPVNIYYYQAQKWASPMIICVFVAGFVVVACSALYEKFLAPVRFIPFELLSNRTVVGSCLVTGFMYTGITLWTSFLPSFLQVVNGLSVAHASYIGHIYNVGLFLSAVLLGFLIQWTGRFKWIAFYFGAPLTILSVALMIPFRQPGVHIGLIVMCQVIIALSGGLLFISSGIAAMAAVSHRNLALALAAQSVFGSIGGAVGSSLTTAIWAGVFPKRLGEYLPPASRHELGHIVGSLPKQLSYPMGSPTRDAIIHAYGDAQRVMLITATAITSLSLFAICMWRDIPIRKSK